MRYGSVCSGIEAATEAWDPLGWEPAFFAEIDDAPRRVLKHHYPDVPLHGDFTTIKGDEYGAIDLLVGGTPCQDFSVAGLREGLDGDRGGLTLAFSALAYRARARWLAWENVFGVLSSNSGRDFGRVLAEFSGRPGCIFEPPEDGWRNSGIVEPADANSYRLAWRVLDLQHFGIPQRRRRVFVVGYFGDWRPAAAVLFERHSLSGDSPPRRRTWEGTAAGAEIGIGECDQPFGVANCLTARMHKGINTTVDEGQTPVLVPLYCQDVADPLVCKEGETYTHEGSGNFRTRNVIASIQERAVSENPANGPDGAGFRDDGIAYTLEARPVPQAVVFDPTQITHPENRSNPQPGDPCHSLSGQMHPPVIAFSSKDHGADATEDCSPTIRAGHHEEGNANGGVPPAVAFKASHFTRGKDGAPSELAPTLSADADKGDQDPLVLAPVAIQDVACRNKHQNGAGFNDDGSAYTVDTRADQGVAIGYVVRRLTPRECERLQGFEDDHTRVRLRHYAERKITKARPSDYWEQDPAGGWWLMMADGPRYRMLGNSKGVPVVRWIGQRIDMVNALIMGEARV